MSAVLRDLVDGVDDAGGGLSDDEPAMEWTIYIADSFNTKLMAAEVVVVDGQITVRLHSDWKIELS